MKMSKKPNVLLLFTDDQRFDTIAALGNDVVKTPNIDKLVARGTAFTHAHIPSGTCGAVCMPSRGMLHSGRTLYHITGIGGSISRDHTTMGEMFRNNGYRTFGTGKWHNGREAFARSFTDGDEIFFGGMGDHWNVPVYHYDPTGKYDATLPFCVNAGRSKEVNYKSADHINNGLHSTEMVCNTTIDFIDKVEEEEPFFAYVSFLAPHDPRVMPERFKAMYKAEDMELPPNFTGGHVIPNGALHIRDEKLAAFPRDPNEVREHIAEYYGMITHLDYEIGRVIQKLEDKDLLEDTIVIFAGDNGLAVGQHGLMGKQSCYEHSNRVPLIYAGPGILENKKRDAYVYLLDIFPTLCELIESDIPGSVEGYSMLPSINSNDEKGRDTIFMGYERYQRAIKDRRYKLIEYQVGGVRNTQLFDLVNDPWETANLAENPEYADTVCDFRRKLVEYSKDWDDKDTEWGESFWNGMEF